MNIDEKMLKMLEGLQADVSSIKNVQQKQGEQLERQGKDVAALKSNITALKGGQEQLELKVEAIHEYQKKAHTEIMDNLFESNEITGQGQKSLEKRIERIEKHLGLPPLK